MPKPPSSSASASRPSARSRRAAPAPAPSPARHRPAAQAAPPAGEAAPASDRAAAAPQRCFWATTDPLLAAYHDAEWGVPVHDDRHWYEKIVLDGAQAGLSWLTILRKRDAYRKAFAGFDPARVARFGARDVTRLMNDAGIVRNAAKIRSAIGNARAFLAVQAQHGSFDAYIWPFVGGRPLQNRPATRADVPARTELSDRLSADLKARGFTFVGSTIVYAFMQAAGLINDHTRDCHRSQTVARLR